MIKACKSSCKHSRKEKYIMFKVKVNLSERGLRNNLYHCAAFIIGGFENTLSDYGEESEEGREAKEWLENRQQMVKDIMADGTSLLYGVGFEGIPSDNKLSDAYSKYPSSTIRRCVEEAIDRVMKEG